VDWSDLTYKEENYFFCKLTNKNIHYSYFTSNFKAQNYILDITLFGKVCQ